MLKYICGYSSLNYSCLLGSWFTRVAYYFGELNGPYSENYPCYNHAGYRDCQAPPAVGAIVTRIGLWGIFHIVRNLLCYMTLQRTCRQKAPYVPIQVCYHM